MIGRGVACIVRGMLPFLQKKSAGSSTVINLQDSMFANRRSARSNVAESSRPPGPSREFRSLASEANKTMQVDGPPLNWPGPEIAVWF
ncbi:hypothetical protein SAMN05444164_3286 [Bradyrhizobium erythrophlei]|uniref:Uncharacterized protein n=2 Tax=Bradyrhizobium erythrophlei TaxID=1437360 RepID=A0A1H4WXE0_9BRAD|nr:hypothetical protein SAMN05444164_3286 [Bradyrhizobium erythrophlei]